MKVFGPTLARRSYEFSAIRYSLFGVFLGIHTWDCSDFWSPACGKGTYELGSVSPSVRQ